MRIAHATMALVAATTVSTAARAAEITTWFTIAMENHNFTQPSTTTSPAQIQGNVAAPYINSLITAGNPNAQYTSYFSNTLNAGVGIHPSEPNYIYQFAGTNVNAANGVADTIDNDPSAAAKNIFTNNNLGNKLTTAGVSWNNYQEDVQYSTSPTGLTSASAPAARTMATRW